ncbi:MAG: hypothetical protein RL030_2768 [Pseudomonadota bacterium]|jgi:hypothetical protein
MPYIGPYSFATMTGRAVTASAPSIPTSRGLKIGRRRPRPTEYVTVEEYPTIVAAWIRAAYYRAAIGASAVVIDDSGVLVAPAGIFDVRCRILPATAGVGATLNTAWLIIPGVTYGDAGQANDYVLDLSDARPLVQPSLTIPSGTSIAVGGITFTTATGDLQWPLDSSQRTQCVALAKALGADEVASPPSASGGQLETTIELTNDQECFDLMRAVRQAAGAYVDVAIGGLTIPGCAVMDVDVTWQQVVGSPNSKTQLAIVRWMLATQDNENSNDVTNTVAVVQRATNWGQWATIAGAVCTRSSEGYCAVAGQAPWIVDLGKVLRGRRVVTHEPTDVSGQWCRICIRKNLQNQLDPKGTQLIPDWWGVILSTTVESGSAMPGATMTGTTAGIAAAFEQLWLYRWYEEGQGGVTDPGHVLPFNAMTGGDASATSPNETVAGIAVVIHDRHRVTGANPQVPRPLRWTALGLVNLVIAAWREQYPQGPIVTLGGQTTALDYQLKYDPFGKSILGILADVISPRWGVGFRFEVDPTTEAVTLRVCTTVASPVTIPGGTTVPANDDIVTTEDLRPPKFTSVRLSRDRTQQVDAIYVTGGFPWYAATFSIFDPDVEDGAGAGRTPELQRNWIETEETAWNTATDKERELDRLEKVWGQWRLREGYNGTTYYASSRNDLFKLGRALDADGGETGLFSDNGQKPRETLLKFTRELPFSGDVDWSDNANYPSTSGNPSTLQRAGKALMKPVLIGKKADGALEVLSNRWDVTIDGAGAVITIGRNLKERLQVKAYIAEGNIILITLGVMWPTPWRVSWRRPQSERPRSLERAIMLDFADVSYHQVVSGTIIGIDGDGAAKQIFSDGANPVRGDFEVDPNNPNKVPRLMPMLDLAKLIYAGVDKPLSYTIKGEIDQEIALGSMVEAVQIALDDQRSITETINQVYTSKSKCYGVDEISTSLTTDRLLPAFDHFAIAPLRANPGALPAAQVGAYRGF